MTKATFFHPKPRPPVWSPYPRWSSRWSSLACHSTSTSAPR